MFVDGMWNLGCGELKVMVAMVVMVMVMVMMASMLMVMPSDCC